MKTTIDLPEEMLHQAKVVAAQRKTTLKELVMQGLTLVTEDRPDQAKRQHQDLAERLIAGLQANNTEPLHPLKREEIYERDQLP